ncbi:MAG: hypothetical protein Edafosvirus24_2 [Edafosvirus sp.]|uniref:Uncharacterized protein n=1 Tax=Edafosvirus sp. TaxID=2487765 RepID=A0A3G4ZUU8_9VIRU|nr:MAG: hypothetical protein Edafosvirus24_2 [Edafosvirus sp.]
MTEDFVDLADYMASLNKNVSISPNIIDKPTIQINKKETVTNKNNMVSKYIKNGVPIVYDIQTMEHYRVLRLRKMDPIINLDLDERKSFAFKYEWDPYTGERLGIDPYGALYFNPDYLIRHFYLSRLNNLWVDAKDEKDGFYQGYYDTSVGAGEDMFIASRGHFPERYVFRLPIMDCYLTKDYNHKFITMGPKLTNQEIADIEEKASKMGNSYLTLFGKPRPSIVKMKKLYDQAISKNPFIPNSHKLTNKQREEAFSSANRRAIEELKKMIG